MLDFMFVLGYGGSIVGAMLAMVILSFKNDFDDSNTQRMMTIYFKRMKRLVAR